MVSLCVMLYDDPKLHGHLKELMNRKSGSEDRSETRCVPSREGHLLLARESAAAASLGWGDYELQRRKSYRDCKE